MWFQRAIISDLRMIIFGQDVPEKMIFADMPKYGYQDPDPYKLNIFISFDFHQVHPTNTLPTSPQSLSGDDFNPNYAQKHDFGPICPNMVIRAQTPQKLKFSIFLNFTRCALLIRFQRALDHYQVLILRLDVDFIPIFANLGTMCTDS